MIITFKVLPESKKDEWMGWFGDDLIKVRLTSGITQTRTALEDFVQKDLGISSKYIIFIRSPKQNFFTYELPDVAWELFLTAIEK